MRGQGVTALRVPVCAVQPLAPFGRPGIRTRSHRTLSWPLSAPITGNVVRSPPDPRSNTHSSLPTHEIAVRALAPGT